MFHYLVIKKFNKLKSLCLSLIIFITASVIFCYKILIHINYWGGRDWDQFTFWNAVARNTILKYHQFPLWNPYANGGNVLLAHPHSCFLSPFYIFVLLFGPVIGLKIEIILHFIIGMWGMFLLVRYHKIDNISSYASSFIYMLGSIYCLHISEGHMEWLPMAFVPWLLLYYLKSLEHKKYIIVSIFFLALILLAGSVDVFNITVCISVVYAAFKSIQENNFKLLKNLLLIFIGTFILCSIKLLPMLEFLLEYPRLTIEKDGVNFQLLCKILLNRNQVFFDYLTLTRGQEVLGLKYRWHEYGAYVGIVPLGFAFIGMIAYFKKRWPLILTGIVFLLIALGSKSPVNLWKVLHYFPVYNSLHIPSRFILGFVFCFSILSGMGMSYLREFFERNTFFKKVYLYKLFLFSIILFIFFDLYRANTPIFKNICWLPPNRIEENQTFAQRYDITIYNNMAHSNMYPAFLSNSGVLDAYEVIHVNRGHVLTVFDPEYKGEMYLDKGKGSVSIISFSPNKIVADVHATEPDTLIVNQNYYKGWRVVGARSKIVKSFNGLISCVIQPGNYRATFYYLPTSFLVGFFITSITSICIVAYYYRRRFKKKKTLNNVFKIGRGIFN